MNNSIDNKIDNIKKMYDKLNYFDQYGGSLVLFVIITIVVILLTSYFHTMINIQPIVDDWPNQRCKPTIIPFAGLINRPEGVSASQYTSENFSYCTQNILTSMSGFALQPLTFITNSLKNMANDVQNSIQASRAMFDKVRTSMQSVSEEIMGRIMNFMISLMQIIISFKDLVGKIQGTMTAGLFTMLGSYYTLKSLMGAVAQFIINILIALSIMIAMFWAVPFTWGAAIANTSIFVALSIPLAIILSFMVNVLKVNTSYKIPKIKCFDMNTLLTMNDCSFKKIIDIEVGDILKDNNVVTAKIKVAREGSVMFKLDNIIVSDSHIVKFCNKWMPVSEHPHAINIDEDYNEPYLYCLNTSNKNIIINNTLFTDWDEIYDETLEKVLFNNLKPVSDVNNIHKFLDCGFSELSKIPLKNGSNLEINKIKINDILENGEKVYGIVEIDGSTLDEQFKYYLGKNRYLEGRQLYLPFINREKIIRNHKLYHLLTDTGAFKIENIIIQDYNAAIDRFLEM